MDKNFFKNDGLYVAKNTLGKFLIRKYDNYEVVSLEMIDSGDWYDAECTLRNTSDKTVEYAEATIKFVDENGDTVFSDWANTMNIEPGDTWHFVIYGLENKDAVKCELGKVTGFN